MPMGRGRMAGAGAVGRGYGAGYGPRRGGGRGRGALIEPVVLAALAGHSAHGYDLRRMVGEITDGAVVVDPGGMYRLLRRLEEGGLVESAWEEGGFGPQRRQYRLTAQGRALLVQWRDELAWRERVFASVVSAIDRSLGLRAEGRRSANQDDKDVQDKDVQEEKEQNNA
ncbi:MAG: PadR family transcriptional regulator [Acidimicrobiales bacterium]